MTSQILQTASAFESTENHSAIPGTGGERAPDHTLLQRFIAQFQALPADTAERVRTAQKIRHQVYCIEHPFEKSNNPDGLESDEFDCHAAQSLLIHRASNAALGTVRMILPLDGDPENSFAVQRIMDAESLKVFNRLPLPTMAEVSRFSISKKSRTQAGTGDESQPSVSGPLMRLGLIQSLVRMSRQHGITHWCAAMEPTLLRMLSAMAIRFTPVGPLVEHHGLRQPCYCVVADVLDAVKRERPAFWAVLTDAGTLLSANFGITLH
ncbi:MAG TPA: PEP-CTERM/exosortase system-associated acyltransferase [Micropepsaceae bacterium]|jgi:N-acyl amino acid synthase of PEP-CTERM/exosortase system|nr:PEP-CTERM/exosortase system-associated acyltransferase [Micropepsaceae bacterium]